MYRLEILELNPLANAKFFSHWLKNNFPDFKANSIGDKVVLYFISEPTEEEKVLIIDKYESLTENDVLILEQIKSVYEVRAADGLTYYDDIRANLAFDYQEGTLTIAQAHYIEKVLINIKSFLLTGDWATAQYELNSLVIDGVVSQTDIVFGYTQELHNQIKAYIDLYVQNNYL